MVCITQSGSNDFYLKIEKCDNNQNLSGFGASLHATVAPKRSSCQTPTSAS